MKVILFASLIAVVYLSVVVHKCNDPSYYDTPTCSRCFVDGDTAADCNFGVPEEYIKNGKVRCCLFITNKGNVCTPISDDQYLHIKDYKKYLNEFGILPDYDDYYDYLTYSSDWEVDKIKCGSHYLSISFITAVILALIF